MRSFGRTSYTLAAAALCLIVLMAVVGTFWSPYDPLQLAADERLEAPSKAHWLGTDHFGRDVFSRLLVGAAVSLRVSLATVILAMTLGTTLGTVGGYLGGKVDRVIAAITDAFLAMPGILLALALIAVLGASELGVTIALGLAYTPNVTRVVRGNVLSLRESHFVEAARLMKAPQAFILMRHIVPNVVGPLTVLASAYFAQAMLSESVLSFLGLGVPPPYPSWGGLLAESRQFMSDAPWLSIFPGLMIVISLLSINLTGDALRDRLDPRMETGRA